MIGERGASGRFIKNECKSSGAKHYARCYNRRTDLKDTEVRRNNYTSEDEIMNVRYSIERRKLIAKQAEAILRIDSMLSVRKLAKELKCSVQVVSPCYKRIRQKIYEETHRQDR